MMVPRPPPTIRVHSFAATHTGNKRGRNEDRFVQRQDAGLWAVLDGVGGQDGERASELAAGVLMTVPAGLPLAARCATVKQALSSAHQTLTTNAAQEGRRAAATTAVVLLLEADRYKCLWVGDSRAYRLRAGTLEQLTRDHSLVQELMDMGAITPQQAEVHPNASLITRAVGQQDGPLDLSETRGGLQTGDDMLLCSDGLFRALDRATLTRLLSATADAADGLVMAALAADGSDNITAVTIHCR